MPSPKTSKLGAVLAFFRKAEMPMVEEGLALVREVIAERKQTLDKIRQGQAKAAAARARGAKGPQAAAPPAAPATPAATAVAGHGGKHAAVAKAKKKQAAAGTAQAPAAGKKRKRMRHRGKAAAATHAAPPADPALTDEELDVVDAEPANGNEPYAEGASQV